MARRNKPKQAGIHSTATRQRQQLAKDKVLAQAEALGVKADQTPKAAQRSQFVSQIADLNVEFQAED
jgi:hypothetical protein